MHESTSNVHDTLSAIGQLGQVLQAIQQQNEAQRMEMIRLRESSISYQTYQCLNRMGARLGACIKRIATNCRACNCLKTNVVMSAFNCLVIITVVLIAFIAILLQYHGVVYFTKTTVVHEGSRYVDPASQSTFADYQRRTRAKTLEIKYLQHLERDLMIEQSWSQYLADCTMEKEHADEEVNKLLNQVREIEEDLRQTIGDQAKYSEAYLYQEEKRRMQLRDEKAEKETYAQLLYSQLCALKGLNDSTTFKRYAEKDTFKWSDMMKKEGICDDDSLGLCKILMR
eukprot:13481_1